MWCHKAALTLRRLYGDGLLTVFANFASMATRPFSIVNIKWLKGSLDEFMIVEVESWFLYCEIPSGYHIARDKFHCFGFLFIWFTRIPPKLPAQVVSVWRKVINNVFLFACSFSCHTNKRFLSTWIVPNHNTSFVLWNFFFVYIFFFKLVYFLTDGFVQDLFNIATSSRKWKTSPISLSWLLESILPMSVIICVTVMLLNLHKVGFSLWSSWHICWWINNLFHDICFCSFSLFLLFNVLRTSPAKLNDLTSSLHRCSTSFIQFSVRAIFSYFFSVSSAFLISGWDSIYFIFSASKSFAIVLVSFVNCHYICLI